MALSGEAEVRAWIEAHPLGETPAEMREDFERLMDAEGGTPIRIAGRHALTMGDGPTCLFLHGGGYVFGSPQSHMRAIARLAEGGLRVVAPTYRLAPEHPWPAQIGDARAVLDALDGPVTVAGISAGGHLALRLALDAPDRIAALALMSPNTDRTGLSETRRANEGTDAMNDDAGDRELGEMALGHLPDDDPEKSPLLADLSGLPPLYVSVASGEVLLDDALLLARRAGIAGVETRLRVTPGLFHMFHLWPDALPGGGAALDRIAAFLQARARASIAG